MRGVIVVQINRKAEKYGFEIGDRIIELNGKVVDDWNEFRDAWGCAKRHSDTGAVFGVSRFGVELPPEPKVPRCLHCGVPGKHLKKSRRGSLCPWARTASTSARRSARKRHGGTPRSRLPPRQPKLVASP